MNDLKDKPTLRAFRAHLLAAVFIPAFIAVTLLIHVRFKMDEGVGMLIVTLPLFVAIFISFIAIILSFISQSKILRRLSILPSVALLCILINIFWPYEFGFWSAAWGVGMTIGFGLYVLVTLLLWGFWLSKKRLPSL